MENLPFSPETLIDELDAMYPERCPDPNLSEREIWIAVGRREVVRFLLELRRRSQEVHQRVQP